MRDLAGCLLFSYAASVFMGNLGLLLFRLNPNANCRAGEVTADCRAFGEFQAHIWWVLGTFLTIVLLWCTELREFLIGTRPHRKKLFSFPDTILLWCIGIEKKSISLDHHRIKYIFVSDYIYFRLNIFSFLHFLIGTRPHRKKNASSYSTRRAWNMGNFFIGTTTENELYVATVLLWCTGQRN